MVISLAIDWAALGQVGIVTIFASAVIAALMSLANWCFSTVGEGDQPPMIRQVAGYALLGLIGLFVLFGLYLMIPYFH